MTAPTVVPIRADHPRGYVVEGRRPGAWARAWAGLAATVRPARRHATQTLYVTLRALKPYALSAGGLACFVVAGFSVSVTLGWTVAGGALLLLEWARDRE